MKKQIDTNYRFFPLSELKNFSRIKHWFTWLKTDIQVWWYRTFYNLNVNCRTLNHSNLPKYGKIVQNKAGIIQINDPNGLNNFVRIIPVDYNYGVSVEIWKDNQLHSAFNMNYYYFFNY